MNKDFVKTCWFVPPPAHHPEPFEHQGSFFADSWDDVKRQNCLNWLKSQGMDTFTPWLANWDPGCRVNFFLDYYGGTVDQAKAENAINWFKQIDAVGAKIVPMLWVADEPKNQYVCEWNYHASFIQAAIQALDQFCDAWMVGCESTRYFTIQQHNDLISIMRRYTSKPVGSHIQWRTYNPLPLIDFLAYEHTWNPRVGDSIPMSQFISETQDVLNKSPIPVWFLEYNININGSKIKEQTRYLLDVARTNDKVIGIGGPYL